MSKELNYTDQLVVTSMGKQNDGFKTRTIAENKENRRFIEDALSSLDKFQNEYKKATSYFGFGLLSKPSLTHKPIDLKGAARVKTYLLEVRQSYADTMNLEGIQKGIIGRAYDGKPLQFSTTFVSLLKSLATQKIYSSLIGTTKTQPSTSSTHHIEISTPNP